MPLLTFVLNVLYVYVPVSVCMCLCVCVCVQGHAMFPCALLSAFANVPLYFASLTFFPLLFFSFFVWLSRFSVVVLLVLCLPGTAI